jgi:hypothetical protein
MDRKILVLFGIVIMAANTIEIYFTKFVSPYINQMGGSKTVMKLKDTTLMLWLVGMSIYVLFDPILGLEELIIASIGLGMVSSWVVDYTYKNFLGY